MARSKDKADKRKTLRKAFEADVGSRPSMNIDPLVLIRAT